MSRSKSPLPTLALFCASLILGGCFGGEESAIRKQLKKVAETASFRPGDGNMGTLTKMKAMEGLFTEDVKVQLRIAGSGSQSLNGLKQLQKFSFAIRPQAGTLDASIRDISIEIDEDNRSAQVSATGMATIEGETEPVVQDFDFKMVKRGDLWLISKATTVD